MIRCAKCGTDNREGRRFCAECGAPLSLKCARCGASNEAHEKFCGECGAALVAGSGASLPASASAAAPPAISLSAEPSSDSVPDGERKTVTALFADIKGSMELMEDLDPEEARAIVDPALKLMIDAVHRYDGYIVQSTGDGIFALFGAPVAHEDHPQRALYAALRMQEELRRYSVKLREGGNLAVEARVGVNTGEVVVRSIKTGDTHTEYTPIGHSTSLAARMQALAPTGSIATTDHTRRLCEGYFTFKALGPTRIKGVSEPVNVVEVTGLGALRTRLQVAAQRGLTRFVGRQAELEQIKRALELACAGHGQIVAAMGEAGVGKSRLFFEFKAVAQSGCLVLEAYSVSHGKASAYLPLTDLLKSYFGIVAEDDERIRREKIAGRIVMLERALEDTLPYLFGLLGVIEGDDPLAQLDPQLRRRRTLEAVKRILARESLNQPLIVLFEDLHWIDSETQALLNLMADGMATARILLLVNYRPEYQHQWGSKTYYTQLRLDPLGKESAEEMLDALLTSPAPAALSAGPNRERACPETPLAEGSPVPSEAQDGRVRGRGGIEGLKRLIIARTEGNPFFMEEMVQTLFEQGVLERNGAVKLTRALNEIRVPSTVQAILASRIDRLPPGEKELLQTLAVLGREFSLSLIKRVAGKSDDDIDPMLSDLQLAEFIYEQASIPDIEYTFKHALTQEVAYNSVLAQRRRLLHEHAAQAIEALFADRLEDHLPELAHHYERSANVRKAVEYLGRAGVRAAEQVAHSEAVGYSTRALELLKRLPDNVDRDRQELHLQLALALSLFVTVGAPAPEREPVLLRARGLCEKLEDNANLIQVLVALSHVRLLKRELAVARELAESALALAEQDEAPAMSGRGVRGVGTELGIGYEVRILSAHRTLLERAHFQLGNVLNISGQFEAAREHYERTPAYISGQDRGFGLPAQLLFTLGYPAAALSKSHESIAAAQGLSDPVAIASALMTDARLHMQIRDSRTVVERTEQVISIATEHGIAFLMPQATFLRGWALAGAGRREALSDMREAMSALASGGVRLSPNFVMLAEACGRNGLREEGLATVAEGLALAEQTGVRYVEAELHRLKGELLLQHPDQEAEAEQCFRTAIDVARRQRARSFELRATISLAHLLERQGKTGEARAMLAEIYGWFTEGFDTADLKDAKALLEELEGKPAS